MKNNNPLNPQAKTDGLVIQELSDEVLVYDLAKNKAYDLNLTSALVWQNCDGNKSVTEIAQTMEKKLNQKVPDELVWLTLEKLKKEGLVSYEKEHFKQFTSVNRRELLKRASFVSLVALPVVVSLVAPIPLHAQSGGAPAPVCFDCVKKSDFAMNPNVCSDANCNSPGTCYDNAGCGGGLFITNVTCIVCHTAIDFGGGPTTGSWVQS
jgi:hypothetical protein